MLSVEYVLAHPDFQPRRAVDRAAALDVRAYITQPLDLFDDIFSQPLIINGQAYDRGESNLDLLKSIDPLLRFVQIAPTEYKVVNLGFKVGLSTDRPEAIATMLVCPRSGLAAKFGLTVINSPGIVDEHYPDWVGAILVNHGKIPQLLSYGARIAQVMYLEASLEQTSIVTELSTSGQRQSGFGSTGV